MSKPGLKVSLAYGVSDACDAKLTELPRLKLDLCRVSAAAVIFASERLDG